MISDDVGSAFSLGALRSRRVGFVLFRRLRLEIVENNLSDPGLKAREYTHLRR